MANKKICLGTLVMVLVFGMAVVGCGDGSTDDSDGAGEAGLNGTWYTYGNVNKYYFHNGDYEYTYNGNPYRKGTYTTTTDSMTMTITHIGSYSMSSYTWLEPSKWYSREQYKTAYVNYYSNNYRTQIQQVYDNYVTAYGVTTANTYFQSAYGTADIDSIVDSYIARSDIGNSMNASLDQLYTSSTVAYSLKGNTLILGGTSYTRD